MCCEAPLRLCVKLIFASNQVLSISIFISRDSNWGRSTFLMATANEPLECVICNEALVDPRALPCGHCYCGPPRLCLNSMESSDSDVIKCAVCRSDHRLKVSDIKPLYGIREYFQSKTAEKLVLVPCSVHNFEECTNWCSTCDVKICEKCFEVEHDQHSMRRLKTYLIEKLEQRMGRKLKDGLMHRRGEIQELLKVKNVQVENLRLRVDGLQLQIADFECDLIYLMKERSLVDEYCNFLNGEALGSKSTEVSLLYNILELNLSEHNVNASSKDQSTQYVGSSKDQSTQYVVASKNCTSQTDSNGKHSHGTNRTPELNLKKSTFSIVLVSCSMCRLR